MVKLGSRRKREMTARIKTLLKREVMISHFSSMSVLAVISLLPLPTFQPGTTGKQPSLAGKSTSL